MYDQYYGFTGRPFQLTPDPHFYFESGTHRKAMSYLGYGLAQGEGFIVITGDVGAGKTTLVGHLMNTIDSGRLTAVKLVSTQVEGDDLLRLVAEQFGIEWEGESKAELLRAMEQYLREQARSEEHTSELQSLKRHSYAVFCLNKQKQHRRLENTQSSK